MITFEPFSSFFIIKDSLSPTDDTFFYSKLSIQSKKKNQTHTT